MRDIPPPGAGFRRIGPPFAAMPVVIAVPHAGRVYPPEMIPLLAVPPSRLEALEDRHADLLVTDAVVAGAVAFVALHARAWIDLNRDAREVDPAMIAPPPHDALLSAKVRGGLGLVPRRVHGVGDLWRGRLPAEALARRVAGDHAPWHAALADALAGAQRRFGAALLIDCHSMPPLGARADGAAPDLVLGDRMGVSAAPGLVAALAAAARAHGLTVAHNAPYAGGYTLDRHGAPARGIHAVQIEIDRALYLAPGLREPGGGVPRVRAMVAALAAAGADWLATADGVPLAAE